jgi:hypothetical protein
MPFAFEASMSITQRIHIVSCAPRSGTTLLRALMHLCFEIDGYSEHELSILDQPDKPYDIFLSKKPREVRYVAPLLDLDPNLWVIYMYRDPRDTIVSRHRKAPDKYWTNLGVWKEQRTFVESVRNHPRFLTVRYEDLVEDADKIQDWLMEKMPFLKKRVRFSEFHTVPEISEYTLGEIGGRRPIVPASIGSWRKHKPRIAAQLALHGPVSAELIDLAYEKDDAWLRELEGVTPDNGENRAPDSPSVRQRIEEWWRARNFTAKYRRLAAGRIKPSAGS